MFAPAVLNTERLDSESLNQFSEQKKENKELKLLE